MKINIAPSAELPRTLSGAKKAPISPAPEPLDPLAFSKQLSFGNRSEIDEKAVLLVELSVIVYSKVNFIRRTFAKINVVPTVIDANGDCSDNVVFHAPRVVAFRHGANAYIAFRGSDTPQDWMRNAMFWPARRFPLRHMGFEITWAEVRAHVENWLAEATQDLGCMPMVHLGGHSLGGAVATLAAVDLAASGYPIARIVTIGSPRVGSWGFRKRYRSSAAAKNVYGNPRFLDQVTTRFTHGTDIVTTILPPPPLAAHVVSAQNLTAEDRIRSEEFLGNNPFDMSLLVEFLSGTQLAPASGYAGGLAQTRPINRIKLMRRLTAQILTWIAMHFKSIGWVQFLPFLPAVFEHARVSSGQHKSARYLAFMPATILGDAYRMECTPPENPSPTFNAEK